MKLKFWKKKPIIWKVCEMGWIDGKKAKVILDKKYTEYNPLPRFKGEIDFGYSYFKKEGEKENVYFTKKGKDPKLITKFENQYKNWKDNLYFRPAIFMGV